MAGDEVETLWPFNEMELDEENGQVMKEVVLRNRRGKPGLGEG